MAHANRNDHWNTPGWLVALLYGAYGYVALDPCSNGTSIVEARQNLVRGGLAADWGALAGGGLVYVNPPYSKPGQWISKCAEEARRGAKVLACLKADPATRAWREIWDTATAVGFIRHRVKFLDPKRMSWPGGVNPNPKGHGTANFPSALVLWGHDLDTRPVLREHPSLAWVRPWPREHLAVQELGGDNVGSCGDI